MVEGYEETRKMYGRFADRRSADKMCGSNVSTKNPEKT